jgi:hypothetical protein
MTRMLLGLRYLRSGMGTRKWATGSKQGKLPKSNFVEVNEKVLIYMVKPE